MTKTANTSRDKIANGSTPDQGKQIAELKAKLAAAEERTRDYGTHEPQRPQLLSSLTSTPLQTS